MKNHPRNMYKTVLVKKNANFVKCQDNLFEFIQNLFTYKFVGIIWNKLRQPRVSTRCVSNSETLVCILIAWYIAKRIQSILVIKLRLVIWVSLK